MRLTCAVTIATHNRKADLERTLASVARLDPPPDELLICADGCTDGTAEMLRALSGGCELIVHESGLGSVASRDDLIRRARSDIIISLDDDSYPVESGFFDAVRALFSKDPRLAVAAFPQRTDEFPETLTTTDFGPGCFHGSFANSGAAIRRSVYLSLGGYPRWFHHAYEEPDFALRCASAGYGVRYVTSLTIRHHYSGAQRNEQRTHHFHARNEIWSAFLRCPAPFLFPIVFFRVIRQFGYACKRGLCWIAREPLWWIDCLRGLGQCLRDRAPVPWRRYKNWMRLVRTPICSEEEWAARFGGEPS